MAAPRTRWAALGLPLLLASPVRMRQDTEPTAATRIVLRESPAIDLWFHVRGLASRGEKWLIEAFGPAALAPAVEAAKELDQALGGFALAWGPIEGCLPGCQTAADVARALERVPEMLEVRGGRSVPVRDPLRKLTAALVAAEPAFLEGKNATHGNLPGLWGEHAWSIGLARARWDENVAPRERELLRYHLESLGMADPGIEIPVYLTLDGPAPGAVTHRDEQGRGVCFVAVGERSGTAGSQLFEIVVHEATHALDLASDSSVLNDLRRALEAAGIGPRERAFRDLPHTLMFVQAAESVRRVVDPEHRDYGDISGYYGRVGGSELVRGVFRDHLEGKLSRAEAVAGIVEGAKTR